ncbi:RNA polymerase sigma factor SigF [Kitasatospora aureofaciens]|uniref:RNA polymerase sigma factor n=1 Tax=Kitasatospora aureofaciens TaxID=1894 RepID=A0A1E7N7G5_KITAU|nr:RNA polymerase sigma factor SigF [Kitasatospora aureofaciens]ARF82290.1 B/F/G family RNA polymerase sigma-70 factor [Kitasatospora aureofaciens]OEV36625.1 RNA polymerase subunit sigma [Kitasatospora aureofaciens]GGU71302.1 RNA polymerase sigma factor [Kitasatospora aureofaciens]
MATTSDELLHRVTAPAPDEAPTVDAPGADRAAAPGLPGPRGFSGPSGHPDLPELADIEDPRQVAPADARELTRVLLARLSMLEEGTAEYSYVRATLIELNLSLVRYAIRRVGNRQEPEEDLIQVGSLGLIKAIDRFDPGHGAEFVTFALPTILGEIRRHFRDATWAVHVPRRLQELRITLAKARDVLFQRLGRSPTAAELADHLDLPEEEVIEGLAAANGHTAGSLDASGTEGEEDLGPLAQRLGEEDRRFDTIENLIVLKPLVAALPERDRQILSMRFGEELTQSQIGARLGLSQMHVSRLLNRTLTRLRADLTAP